MATLVSALNTVFTPATGTFIAQATGNQVVLQSRNTSGAAWVIAAPMPFATALLIDVPVSGVQFRFVSPDAGAVVQADQ